MAKQIVQTFKTNSQWVAPAGVTSVRVTGYINPPSVSLAYGANSARMIDSFGKMYAWGANVNGQLGDGTVVAKSSPVTVLGGLTFKQTILANGASFGLARDGKLYAWGVNGLGQLGVGDIIPRSSPVLVLGGKLWQQITALNSNCFCGLAQDGSMYAWGFNSSGQLGVGDVTPRSSPVLVLGGLKFKYDLRQSTYNGSINYIGLTSDGTAYGWGLNTSGQLGVGDVINRSSPVAVIGGLKFRSIQPTSSATYGITNNGYLYGWGFNTDGSLGVGDTTNRSSPVAILPGVKIKQVTTTTYGNAYTTLALGEDGTLWAWGANAGGQLGVGTFVDKSTPTQVLGGLKFAKVFVNDFGQASYGITLTGQLYAWGNNGQGQLGVGDVNPRSSPVAVLGGLTFSNIITANAQIFGITTTGKVYAWGANALGTLGDGTIVNKSSPVALVGVIGQYLANISTQTFDTTVQVTPGTTYQVLIGQATPTFGNTSLGAGPFDYATIEYFA